MKTITSSALWSKAIALSFVLAITYFPTYAQNEDVINVKVFTPTISDAFKELRNPSIPDTSTEKLDVTYTLSPVLYNSKFPAETIKPAKMIGEKLNKLYRSYAKLGFGNKMTTFGEYYYSNLRSTDQSMGFYFKHHSSSGKIKNYAFPGFSDNEAGLYAKKFYKHHTLAADVDYNRNVVHYYGFNPADFPLYTDVDNKDSIKQRLMTIGGKIKFFSTYVDSSHFNHTLSLDYRNASDRYDAMEDRIAFRSSINKNVKLFKKTLDNQNFSLQGNVDFLSDHNKTDTTTGAVVSLVPKFSASIDILKFSAGFNTTFKINDSSDISIYPVAGIDLNLFNNVFILYGNIDGSLAKNSMMDLFAENPFINTSLPLDYTKTCFKFRAGVKGSLSSYLSYNAYFSKSKVENMPLFVNDTTTDLMNKFTVIYDDASILNTHTEITYQKAEKIKLMLISNYFEYKMSTEKSAWHKPAMDVRIALNYNLKDKIILKTEVFALSSCDAKTYDLTGVPEVKIERIKGTVDFNLGLEYRYSKILSGFINFNNIGAVRYQKWYHYPTYGFNVLGGVTYAF